MQVLETERLRLRPLEDRDRAAFAAMNADPEVMAHFPKRLTRAESDAALERILQRYRDEGYAFAAIESRADGAFIGMAGIARVRFAAPVEGATEIGWRLARACWGQGIATEAARAWLDHGFHALGLDRIVAFTTPANIRSRAVMGRIGMTRAPDLDFEHPHVPQGHPMRPHQVWIREAVVASG